MLYIFSVPTVLVQGNKTKNLSLAEMNNDVGVEVSIEDTDLIYDSYVGDTSILQQCIDENYGDDDVGLMLDGINNTLSEFDLDIDEGNIQRKDFHWKILDDDLCNNVTLDFVSNRNLNKAKQLCNLTLQKAITELRIPRMPNDINNNQVVLGVDDCINFFLRREWYFLLEDSMNIQLQAMEEDHCTVEEILKLQKLWLLQMLEKQTANSLYQNPYQRWGLVNELEMKEERMKVLMKAFK